MTPCKCICIGLAGSTRFKKLTAYTARYFLFFHNFSISLIFYTRNFIPASNEPSRHACMSIWRLPQGSNIIASFGRIASCYGVFDFFCLHICILSSCSLCKFRQMLLLNTVLLVRFANEALLLQRWKIKVKAH